MSKLTVNNSGHVSVLCSSEWMPFGSWGICLLSERVWGYMYSVGRSDTDYPP